jgi:radical SAM-linked protein
VTPPRTERIRIRFDKFGRIRFTSHRDVARVWERSLRRSRLPVSYSEGFSPRPRLRFGLALATAHESCGEYLDVDLEPGAVSSGRVDIDELAPLVNPMLPPGMTIQATAHVEPGAPSLQESVDSCTWLVDVPQLTPAQAHDLVERALAAEELPVTRTRKGKSVTDDIRPNVLALRVADPDERPPAADWQPAGALLRAELGTHPRACRPAELLAAVDPTLEEGRVVRLHQWTKVDGVRREPVPLEATPPVGAGIARPSAAHAVERAS